MHVQSLVACEQQTYFQSFLQKITLAISSCKTISVTSIFLHHSEFGWALRGDVDVREKNKMAEDGESSLDDVPK